MKITSYSFEGEGMKRVYENADWTVGIKNYKPANDRMGIDMLERHNESDELFVLLDGSCTLISAVEGNGMSFEAAAMEPGRVYVIPRTLWHNTVTTKDTKMVLIEYASTGEANSDFYKLKDAEIQAVRALVKE